MNSFIKKKTTSTGIALLSIFGGSGGGIPAIKICRQSCKAIFVLLLLTLTGCKRSTDVEFDTVQKQSPNAPVLTQFSFTVDKGQVLTMDAAPYVNSDKSWQLTSVTDPKGLVSNISINGSSATMTADHAGVTALSWLITQEGKTYSSVFYLAVQDVSSSSTPPTAADIRRSTDSETSISIDLSQAVSDADGDTLTISMFAQSPDRFTLDGMDVTYTPSGYVGNDIAMYSVEDGSGGFAIGQISVIVNDANPPVPNTPPTADDHAVSLNQGESLDIDISTLVSDSDGDDVSLTKLIAASGRASITDAKTITYSSGSFSGLDSFVYIVSDGKGGIAQAEIQVTVNPVAVPPPLQTNPLVLSMTAGNTTVFDISSSVSSGLDWQLTAVNDPAGLVKVGIIASQSVTLTALSSGIARVSYTAETANESKSSELIISISEADTTPPKARNITLNTDNITPLSVNLSAYISGTDSDSLRVTKLLQANTRFKLSGSTVTYTPANFIGVDSAAYVVEDKRGGFAVGYISVVVKDANPPVPNTPPTAENHAVSLNQGESLDIDISTLVNDSDGDEVSLTKLIAASGRASITDAKTITYSSGSFSGLDSFVYIVSDGKGGIAQAEIQVTVHPVAVPAPLQVNPLVLSMTAGETRPFDISSSVSSGLDWQLSDVNDPTGLVKVGTIASPSVTLTALSSGIARVRYTAETANESKSSELIISISERDTTPPKAQNVTLETDNDTSVTVDLSAYISGADSDSLRVTKLLQTDERFVLSGSKVTYNPAGFIGVDSATYVVENERGGYGLGLIMVNVADANPPVPNNPPTAKGYTQTTDSDTSVSLDLSALKLIGDPDGDPLSVTLHSSSGRAAVSGHIITYTPNGFFGRDEVVYQVSDGRGGNAAAAIVYIVSNASPIPDVPLLTPFADAVNKGLTLTIDAATYVDSDKSWQLTSVTDPKGLVSNIRINGSSATMTADHAGVTALSWEITQESKTYSSTFYLAVQDVSSPNTPPKAANIRRSTDNETPVSIDLSQAVSDADGDTLTISMFVQSADRFTQNGMDVKYTSSGYVGNDIAMYSVEDGRGGFAIGYISVVVTDANPPVPNTPPTAENHAVFLNQGESLDIDISTLVSDSDGDDVSLTKLIAASGRASITDAKTITYSSGSFSGLDSFVYMVSDGKGGIAQAEIQVNVHPVKVPAPLQTNPLVLSMTAGETRPFDISSSVSSGLDWQLSDVNDTSGLVQVGTIASPSVTLTALSSGIARVRYTAETANESKSSELIISISEPDTTPPKAQNVTLKTDNDASVTVDLSSYFSGADSDSLRVTKLLQTDERFVLSGSKVTYNPAGFIGVDSATYVVENERGGYGLGLIMVNVADANPPVPNNPPTAKGYTQTTDSDTSVSLDLSALKLIGDADNDPLRVTLHSGGGRAKVSGHVITYTPNGFIGSDEVVYQVSDGRGGNAVATIVYTVSDAAPVNTPPTADPHSINLTLKEVLSQPVRTIDITPLVSDADGDTLTVTNVYAGVNPVSIDGPLSVKYTASASVEIDQFTYVVSDGRGGFALSAITVHISNAAPEARPAALSIDPYDSSTPSLSINMADYTSDPDGDALTLTQIGSVASPATLTQSGLILTYTPNGALRTENISYTVSDGQKSASNVISIISASKSALQANDIALPAMDMDAATQVVDVSAYVNSKAGRPLVISKVFGAGLGSVTADAGTLTFTYTPNNISYGEDTFYYEVTDNEGRYAAARVTVSLNEPASPVITDLQLNYGPVVTAVMTCSNCDTSRTAYQFNIAGVLVGTNSNSYPLAGNDKEHNIGVLVTAKNQYCTAQNSGVSGGNACRTTQSEMVIKPAYVQDIYSTNRAFAAVKSDGSVVTWGREEHGGDSSEVHSELSNVQHIYGTAKAFAAVKADGSVVTWGHPNNGGNSNPVQTELSNVLRIVSTDTAFAAVKADGSVVTWGDADYGGDSPELTDVQDIYSNDWAFAAVKTDGSVVAWGDAEKGGSISKEVQDKLTDVQRIVSNDDAFAAVKADGSVVAWGDPEKGGSISKEVQDKLTNVQRIVSNKSAFAAVKADGSVVTWGDAVYGGNSSAVQSDLRNVQRISATYNSFAAVRADGSVVTWGGSDFGGDSDAVQALLTDVQRVYGTGFAFAAVKADGSVLTWGQSFGGGDSSQVEDKLKAGVVSISSNDYVFAAVKADGSVVTWGHRGYGGDSSAVQSDLSNVQRIYTTISAVAAVKADGSVVAWGDANYGGDSSAVQEEFISTTEIYKNLDVN